MMISAYYIIARIVDKKPSSTNLTRDGCFTRARHGCRGESSYPSPVSGAT